MSAEVIKEFLVSLGYKVDGSSEKKFKEAVRGATLQAMLLAKAVEEAAEAAVKAVAKIATGFDQLYWSSQRTNAAAGNIRAFAFAVSQMGGSVDGARSSIEGIGRAMRNPGIKSMINALGVATEKNGKLRDTVEIMGDLGKALGKKPRAIADQYAQILGLDDNTLTAMIAGTEKWQAIYNERQKKLSLDPEKAAENANRFMQTFRNLQDTLETIFDKLAVDFSEPMLKAMQDLDAWLREHYDDIRQFIGEVAEAARKAAEAFRELAVQLKPAWEGFDRVAKSLTGNDGLTAAFIALGIVLTGKVLSPLAKISGLLLGMTSLPAWMMALLGIGTGVGIGAGESETVNNQGLGRALRGEETVTERLGRELAEEKRKERAAKGVPEPPKDDRNIWERIAPKWLGGKDGPQKVSSVSTYKGTPVEKAALDVISDGEADSYNRIVGGGTFDDYSKHPNKVGVWTRYGPSTAAGRYQFTKSTWDPIAKELGLTDFSPESQDKAALHLAQKDYKRRTGRDLMADLNNGVTEYLREGLGGSGRNTTWQAFQKKSDTRNRQVFEKALAKHQAAVSEKKGFWAGLGEYLPSMSANAATFDQKAGSAALAPSASSIANDNSRNVTIGDTNITVHGSGGDPEDLASAIGRASHGSQAALLRNVQGAVR